MQVGQISLNGKLRNVACIVGRDSIDLYPLGEENPYISVSLEPTEDGRGLRLLAYGDYSSQSEEWYPDTIAFAADVDALIDKAPKYEISFNAVDMTHPFYMVEVMVCFPNGTDAPEGSWKVVPVYVQTAVPDPEEAAWVFADNHYNDGGDPRIHVREYNFVETNIYQPGDDI